MGSQQNAFATGSSVNVRHQHHSPSPDPSNYFVVDESGAVSTKTSLVDKQLPTKQASGMTTRVGDGDVDADDRHHTTTGDSRGDSLQIDTNTNNNANSPTLDSSSINGNSNSNNNNNYDDSDDYETANQIKLSHVIVIVLEPQHAGSYQCFAYNQYETVQSSAYIKVLDDPPKFKDTFKSEVFEQHQDISLQCSAKANPLPEITWSIDEQPIPESSRTRFGDFVTKVTILLLVGQSVIHSRAVDR